MNFGTLKEPWSALWIKLQSFIQFSDVAFWFSEVIFPVKRPSGGVAKRFPWNRVFLECNLELSVLTWAPHKDNDTHGCGPTRTGTGRPTPCQAHLHVSAAEESLWKLVFPNLHRRSASVLFQSTERVFAVSKIFFFVLGAGLDSGNLNPLQTRPIQTVDPTTTSCLLYCTPCRASCFLFLTGVWELQEVFREMELGWFDLFCGHVRRNVSNRMLNDPHRWTTSIFSADRQCCDMQVHIQLKFSDRIIPDLKRTRLIFLSCL